MRARRERWRAERVRGIPSGSFLRYAFEDLPAYVQECLRAGTALPSRVHRPRKAALRADTRLARMLSDALQRSDVSAQAVSTSLGFSPNALQGLLTGERSCTPTLALRIEKALGLPAQDLVIAQALDALDAARLVTEQAGPSP